MNKCEDCMLEK